eukprot:TRINITY_DN5525_c1_g1_i2.p3 TRINITY_DN5525_c1_g1~~TRINITY_DN5525_c1_g1_i2.p3  ORF type:complete len:103 (+),score=46.23 TRINITY_DN5525_c1_g1_i2:156-464(+)
MEAEMNVRTFGKEAVEAEAEAEEGEGESGDEKAVTKLLLGGGGGGWIAHEASFLRALLESSHAIGYAGGVEHAAVRLVRRPISPSSSSRRFRSHPEQVLLAL